ncbi:unnamed protein product [Paramecium pentaurelia]|uniref:NAD(P)(+)--arginine ADP-ribosyltransferase n=1 Tax=Paramecium pentaurelia TaxID=43138 RepID=A0A8S1VTW8_9CILI|nr:unnamed protein product [Paramecium pentaurelia]
MDLPPIADEINLQLGEKIDKNIFQKNKVVQNQITQNQQQQPLQNPQHEEMLNTKHKEINQFLQSQQKQQLSQNFYDNEINLMVECQQLNKTYPIRVNRYQLVEELRREFQEILQTQNDIQFHFYQIALDGRSSFAEYGIANGSVIKMFVMSLGGCFPFYAPITLADKSQKPISEIIKGDQILCYNYEYREFRPGIVQGTTKTKYKIQLIRIETETSIIDSFEPHPDFQISNLTLEDKLLFEDNTFINIISIQKLNQFDYVYNLHLKYPNNYLVFGFLAHNMNIIYVQINGKNFKIEYFPEMPIQQIKVLIFKKMGIPIENQKLYYQDILMEDEKTIKDYNLNYESEKLMEVLLDVSIDKEKQQQQSTHITSNSNIISVDIITNESSYNLLLYKDIDLKYLQKIIRQFEDTNKKKLILIDGLLYKSEFDDIRIDELPKIQQILLLSKEEGGLSISFYNEIYNIGLNELSELKRYLQSLQLNFNVDQYLKNTIEQINIDQQKQGIYQKYKLHNLIALKLWTSNLLYRQLNCDLKNNSYEKWKKYLKCLIEGIKSSQYYRGKGFRGIKQFQDVHTYQIDKTIQWRDIQAISLKEEVAQRFSDREGMIFEIEMISSKDISQISVYPNEQEVIMMPFSTYKVLEVIQDYNQPIFVSMREIPFAKNTNYIVLWVDDNPENNYQIAKKM